MSNFWSSVRLITGVAGRCAFRLPPVRDLLLDVGDLELDLPISRQPKRKQVFGLRSL
jgi:hypothetical protein